MRERLLRRSQWVPRPLDEVFPFFSRPENLAVLTPPDLGFEFLTPSPIPMAPGSAIDYRVRPFGVPMRWRTVIESYDPPRSFADTQARGPYALWHHTHSFAPERGGTRMTDTVRYRLPFGPLGALAEPLVERELARIFDFRERAVAALFPPRPEAGMDIVLAGGSGFIGGHLARALLVAGHRVTVLTRGGRGTAPGAREVGWDGRSGGAWEEALASCDAVVNLCGAGVADRPWTQARRRELVESRLAPTRALVEALARAPKKGRVLVNASAVGLYGDAGTRELPESAPRGAGFLADLCAQWEAAALGAAEHGARVVLLRIGVVLGADGGALGRMLLPFKFALGGRLGSGSQYMPWIHVDDVVGLVLKAVSDPALAGPVNAVAPGAATNAEFTRALGAALGRPTPFPVPAFALRLVLGDMSSILLDSQKVVPAAALKAGYGFRHPEIGPALRDAAGAP